MTLTLDIVTPKKLVASKEAHMVVVPGTEGNFGVLEGHAGLVSTICTGVINIYDKNMSDVSRQIFVTGGFAEITDKKCTILANKAFDLADLSQKDAQDNLEKAEKTLSGATSDEEKSIAEKELSEAKLLLKAFTTKL